MMRCLFIVLLIAALVGCSSSVQWDGAAEVNCFGVKVALPHSGRGSFSVGPDSLTWEKGSLTLTFRRSENGAVLMQRNGEAIGTALPGQVVKFTEDGQIESQE
jgi:hypothetical protein